MPLTATRRASLIKSAQTTSGTTARQLALGAQEKLVVKDVVQDADGTVHTRYERTYAGLPVLGGDLVVHLKSNRTTVSKASGATLTLPTLTPKLSAANATGKALAAAKGAEVTGAEAEHAARLVVWAGATKPVLAWETLVEGVQPDGTPSELQVVTDASTGKQLLAAEKVHTGEGTGQYVGTVSVGSTLGIDVPAQRPRPRRAEDVRPEPGHLRHRHPLHRRQRCLGRRSAVQPPDRRCRRGLRRGSHLGLLQGRVRP